MVAPYPKNAPGDFYREDGCCTSCAVAVAEAPENLRFDEEDPYGGCFVAKQPENPAEVEGMIHAMDVTEVDCFRYRGSDPEVIQRLRSAGHGGFIDPPDEAAESHRLTEAAEPQRRPPAHAVVEEIWNADRKRRVELRRRDDGSFDYRDMQLHVFGHSGRRTFHSQWLPTTLSKTFASAEKARADALKNVRWLSGQETVVSLADEESELRRQMLGKTVVDVVRGTGLDVRVTLNDGTSFYVSSGEPLSCWASEPFRAVSGRRRKPGWWPFGKR